MVLRLARTACFAHEGGGFLHQGIVGRDTAFQQGEGRQRREADGNARPCSRGIASPQAPEGRTCSLRNQTPLAIAFRWRAARPGSASPLPEAPAPEVAGGYRPCHHSTPTLGPASAKHRNAAAAGAAAEECRRRKEDDARPTGADPRQPLDVSRSCDEGCGALGTGDLSADPQAANRLHRCLTGRAGKLVVVPHKVDLSNRAKRPIMSAASFR